MLQNKNSKNNQNIKNDKIALDVTFLTKSCFKGNVTLLQTNKQISFLNLSRVKNKKKQIKNIQGI